MLPRMKQPHDLCCARIEGGNIASLVPIAEDAGISQVVRGGRAAVLATDDTIHLMREAGVVFVDEAVFAPVARAAGYFGSEFLADVTGHGKGSDAPSPSPFSECAPTP